MLSTQAEPPAFPDHVDPLRFAQATVVLRVRRRGPAAVADDHRWDEVEVLTILKNASARNLGKRFLVASLNSKSGVPAETCTIYLEPYQPDEPKDHHWKLLGGGVPDGVSHVAPAVKHGPGR